MNNTQSDLTTNNILIGHQTSLDTENNVIIGDEVLMPISLHSNHSILIYGNEQSGKTRLALKLAMEEVRKGKTVFYVDTTRQSYIPFLSEIPQEERLIICPQYQYLNLTPEEKNRMHIDRPFFININSISGTEFVELYGLNSKSMYAPSFLDTRIRDLAWQTQNNYHVTDFYSMLNEIIEDENLNRIKWAYQFILEKLERTAKYYFGEEEENRLDIRQILEERVPKLVIITFHSFYQNDDDDELGVVHKMTRSSILASVLSEITHYIHLNRNANIGVYIDDADYWLHRNNRSMICSRITSIFNNSRWHDTHFSRVIIGKIWQIPSNLRDNWDARFGTYNICFELSIHPNIGIASFCNRIMSNNFNPYIHQTFSNVQLI